MTTGKGSYAARDWTAYASTHVTGKTDTELFTNKDMDAALDPKAGFKRNQKMLNDGRPTHILAIIDKNSKTHGTDHMCSISSNARIVVKKIFYN